MVLKEFWIALAIALAVASTPAFAHGATRGDGPIQTPEPVKVPPTPIETMDDDPDDSGFAGVRFGLYERNWLGSSLNMSFDRLAFEVRDSSGSSAPMLSDSDLDLQSGYGAGFALEGGFRRFRVGVSYSRHWFDGNATLSPRTIFVGDVQIGAESPISPSASVTRIGFEAGYAIVDSTRWTVHLGIRVDSLDAEIEAAPSLSQSFSGLAYSGTVQGVYFLSPSFDLGLSLAVGDRMSVAGGLMWGGFSENWMVGGMLDYSVTSFESDKTTTINLTRTVGEHTLTSLSFSIAIWYTF